jgi:hypothetical protein
MEMRTRRCFQTMRQTTMRTHACTVTLNSICSTCTLTTYPFMNSVRRSIECSSSDYQIRTIVTRSCNGSYKTCALGSAGRCARVLGRRTLVLQASHHPLICIYVIAVLHATTTLATCACSFPTVPLPTMFIHSYYTLIRNCCPTYYT